MKIHEGKKFCDLCNFELPQKMFIGTYEKYSRLEKGKIKDYCWHCFRDLMEEVKDGKKKKSD